MIILVIVCRHVLNGKMFYRVIIVTTNKKFSARRGMTERWRSQFYEHAPSGIFTSRKFSGSLKETGTSRRASSPFPLLYLTAHSWGRRERVTRKFRRCEYWTYFFKANWGEPRRRSVKNFSRQDHITILYVIHGAILTSLCWILNLK